VTNVSAASLDAKEAGMGSTVAGTWRHDRILRSLVAIVLTGLVAVGCAGSDDGASFDQTAGDTPEARGPLGGLSDDSDADPGSNGGEGDAPPRDPAEGDGSTAAAPVVLATTDLGRSIIYTATVEIEVDDVAAASREAQQAIAGLGGVIFGQDTTTDPRPRTVLVFKVQPADFAEAMQRLDGIGRVVSQDISADDVTDRVVDLQSRILTAEVSVERLRRLLDGAASVEAIAALEGQLLDRETNLELLRGQLRTVQAQVALATITVTISQKAADAAIAVAVTAYDGDDEGDRCPGERRLEADEGRPVILCVAIDNTGNVALTDIEVRDLGLDLRREDFTLIGFGGDDQLAPGELVIAWARFEPAPRARPNPSVTAVPVDDEGEPIRTTTQVIDEPVVLEVIPDDSLPGFRDSLGAGWGALQRVFGIAVVVVGAVAPFAVVLAVPAAIYLWWTRREEETMADDEPSGAPTPA
jgi:hypothetical protein